MVSTNSQKEVWGKLNSIERRLSLAGGGGSFAPSDAEYVVMSLSALLPNERVLTAGVGLSLVDGGAGGNATLNVDVGIADDDIVQIDSVAVADNDYAKFTANGLEGRNYAEVLSDLSAQALAAFDFNSQNLTSVGTIGCGVISSGPDTDISSTFGRTIIGHLPGAADHALFSHIDKHSIGNYAVLQNASGQTMINASTGQGIYFRINNVTTVISGINGIQLQSGKYIEIKENVSGKVFLSESGYRYKNLLVAGNWDHKTVNISDSGDVSDMVFGGYGTAQVFNYGYIGLAFDDTWIRFDSTQTYFDVDLFTDRWLSQDTNTFIGIDVAGAGNLAHGGGPYEGYHNTFVGWYAGRAITTGYANSIFGSDCGRWIESGHSNSFFGLDAGYYTTDGDANTFVGISAGMENTTGSYNIAIGYEAGRYQADGIAVLQTPENSIYIGVNSRSGSDPAGGEDVITNEIVIGYNAIGNKSNTMTLGNSSLIGVYTDAFLYLSTIKSGATQAGAGAAADELWKTASHATLPDNVVMIGV